LELDKASTAEMIVLDWVGSDYGYKAIEAAAQKIQVGYCQPYLLLSASN
jgi:hypothetical protein